MKQTPVTIMTWIAYVQYWSKTTKQIIISPRDKFAHDTKFILFLRACFLWSERENGSTCVWLDSQGRDPMTEADYNEFIQPLVKLNEAQLYLLCQFADITPEDVSKFIAKLNLK